MIELLSSPCSLARIGTFPLPGVPGATYTLGREPLQSAIGAIMGDPVALDTEGAGLDSARKYNLKALQVCSTLQPDHALIFDPRDPAQRAMGFELISNAPYVVIHNSPHDVHISVATGCVPLELCNKLIDTLIWARLADPDERKSHGLSDCATLYLDFPRIEGLGTLLQNIRMTQSNWYLTRDLDTPAYVWGAASDVLLTAKLLEPLRRAALRRLTEGHPFIDWGLSTDEANDLLTKCQVINRPLLRRQCKGFRVDEQFIETYRQGQQPVLENAAKELEAEGVKPGDSTAFALWLDERGALPGNYPRTDKKGVPSGQAHDLESLSHPLVPAFLTHKRITKVNEDYLGKALRNMTDGRIRPGTNLLAATTGRMSVSGDSALQQWPEAARGGIAAEEGEEWVAIDWSQIEVVFAAYLSQDHEFLDMYEREPYDVHQLIADLRLHRPASKQERSATKAVVFGTIYGEGIKALARDLRCSIAEAKQIQDEVFKVLPGVHRTCGKGGKLMSIAQDYQICFTVAGRIIPIGYGKYGVAAHKGVNYPVQGGAYDLLAEVIYQAEREGYGDAINLAMHDELVVNKEARDYFVNLMQTPPERFTRLAGRKPVLRTGVSELGPRWGK